MDVDFSVCDGMPDWLMTLRTQDVALRGEPTENDPREAAEVRTAQIGLGRLSRVGFAS